MDKTLTLQQFAQMVATTADIPADEAMSFITSLTGHIKGMLCDGEKAHLPGIGTFAAIEDKDGNATVVFAPDESFSESVNEPFAMFEPVELSDNAALDIAASEVQPPLQSSTDNGTTTPLPTTVTTILPKPTYLPYRPIQQLQKNPSRQPLQQSPRNGRPPALPKLPGLRTLPLRPLLCRCLPPLSPPHRQPHHANTGSVGYVSA